MKKSLLSILVLATMLLASVVGRAQTSYALVTSNAGLEVGVQYLIVGFEEDGSAYAMSYQKSNNRHAVNVSEDGGTIVATVATDPNSQSEPFEFVLGGAEGAWTLYDPLKEGYLNAPGGGNYLRTQTELTDNGRWAITIASDGSCMPVSNGGVEQAYMRYNPNNGTPLISCYKESSSVNSPLFFFKAGGAAQPDPEPTNYPTNFAVSVDAVSATLTWTDAVGGQLPAKYLVVGSMGAIPVPSDGTPVENGDLVMNVNYGVQTVTFEGLQGNSTYHFAIFPYTNSGSNIDYKTDGSYPVANAQTPNIDVLLNEHFENELGVFTAYNVYGDQVWHQATYNNNSYAYMNGYANGVANQNEDWLISPELNGNFTTINLSFKTAKNYDGDDLRLLVSSDYDGESEPSDFEWDELTDMFDWSNGGYEWVESGEMNIAPYVGDRFYLAFVYTSYTNGAAAWEVDDVFAYAMLPAHVGDVHEKQLTVSPNPASDRVRIELEGNATVTVFDLSGRMVMETSMGAGSSTLQVANLENGIYFISVSYADGKKEVVRFVKL